MVKKKIDNRIRVMIENGVKLGHRSMFIIVGDKARDQVPILYDMLTKSTVRARPTVLWCYKNKDDMISGNATKRMKKIKAGKISVNDADLFDTFRVSTKIHGRFYNQTHMFLGKTYGVCVLQDFEAVTPNLLARTVETVEGGGLIILLLKTMTSLKQLYTMCMDIHSKYRTEAHQNITCRFNERLILSLADCNRCLLMNDDLTVLPLSSKTANIQPIDVSDVPESSSNALLAELKENLRGTPPAGPLINLCRTHDQAKAVAQFIDALAEKSVIPPTSLTAARGRGKSAAMGLSIAAAVAFGYVNIYVTSPHPENLVTLFEFIEKGLDALEYQEHADYSKLTSTHKDFNNAIVRINITRKGRQTIQYISPTDAHLLDAADLLVIDEAAAIPLTYVNAMIKMESIAGDSKMIADAKKKRNKYKYLVFMASTINGYEGTGRSLSLKLLSQIQKEHGAPLPIKLDESIRYKPGDAIESWLNSLLCLDAALVKDIDDSCTPELDKCELYYVDRNALFSYHRAAEAFLQRLVAIYVASHYKNSPDDLQMMSDAPAYHIFCLLGPITKTSALPEILVVVLVSLEGQISSSSVRKNLSHRNRPDGDMIPWKMAEQFNDSEFPKLAGARIVRIATHPKYQGKGYGYGKRAIKLLKNYYAGQFTSLDENDVTDNDENGFEEIDDEEVGLLKERIAPRKKIPTLLKRLSERKPESLDYIGVSYGLTLPLLKFWKYGKFVPVYLRQNQSDLTGEHTLMMISILKTEKFESDWLSQYYYDFRRRFIRLLSKSFQNFTINLALSLLDNKSVTLKTEPLTQQMLDTFFIPHDIQRLDLYTRNQIEYPAIIDLTSALAQLVFEGKMNDAKLSETHKTILLGIGLQNKPFEKCSQEMNLAMNQILTQFSACCGKLKGSLESVSKSTIEKTLIKETELNMGDKMLPTAETLADELEAGARELAIAQKKELKRLKNENLATYAIKGTDEEWGKALATNKSSIISVKSGEKRLNESIDFGNLKEPDAKKKKLKNNKNHRKSNKF